MAAHQARSSNKRCAWQANTAVHDQQELDATNKKAHHIFPEGAWQYTGQAS